MSQNSLALQMHNGSSEYKHEGKKDSFKNVILRSITNQMSFNLQLTVGQLNVQRMRKIQVMLLITKEVNCDLLFIFSWPL